MAESTFYYDQRALSNELVSLVPFGCDEHVAPFLRSFSLTSETLKYVTFPVISTEQEFRTEIWDHHIAKSQADCMYAIYALSSSATPVKDVEPAFAGIISLSNTNPTHAITEVGIMIAPAFQRTYVATNAVGLLLMYLLDPPSMGGLGLRRVEWQAHVDNTPSRAFATRLGFELEGIMRWHRAVAAGKAGGAADALASRNGATTEAAGRHTAVYAIVWDEWEEKRRNVSEQMKLRNKHA